MSHIKMLGLLIAAGFLIASPQAKAQLLKGYIQADSIPNIQVAYTPNGDFMDMVYKDINPAKDGSFNFDTKLDKQMLDANVYVGNEIFGVHLEQGKSAVIRLKYDADTRSFNADFSGDNVVLSRFYNAYSQAFDIMKYFSTDPKKSEPTSKYRSLLEEQYAALKKLLPTIKDKTLRQDYAQLSDGMYKWTKMRILMDQAEDEKKSVRDYPEYMSLVRSIDPNDEKNIRNNLIFAWLTGQQKEVTDYEGDQTDYYLESMNIVDRSVTNPVVRKMLARYLGFAFFTYAGGKSDVKRFWARYQTFAKNYPDLLSTYEDKYKSFTETTEGKPVPYNPVLTRLDGSTCHLSDLYGKFLYIDVWATWCVPCRKETPYLKQVVDHFKDNDKVRIISISIDSNNNAWQKLVKTEQPSWDQYILSPEETKQFLNKWGISGIPRFIMLDKEGHIFSGDALRPSDKNIIQTIEGQLK